MTVTAKPSTASALVAESEDTSQLMVNIMNAPHLTQEDVDYLISSPSGSNLFHRALALVKNPSLTTEQLSTSRLMGLISTQSSDDLFSLNYYLAHPNMTAELVEKMAENHFATREERRYLRFVGIPVAYLTSPVAPDSVKKAAIKQLVSGVPHSNYQSNRSLQGLPDPMDPTVMLRSAPSLSGDQIRDLYRRFLKAKSQPSYRAALLANPACPVDMRLDRLKKSKGRGLGVHAICANPALTAEELDVIREKFFSSSDFREETLGSLIDNPSVTFMDEIYDMLTNTPEMVYGYFIDRTLMEVVQNPNLSAEKFRSHLMNLHFDYLKSYREDIFDDPRATDELREHLLASYRDAGKIPPVSWTGDLSDEESTNLFRDAVAADRVETAKTTDDLRILELAVRDAEFDVRAAVARNEKAPAHMLATLSQDEDSEVRGSVTHRVELPLECQEELAVDPSFNVRMSLAQNRNIPVEVARILVKDRNWQVRGYLANNRDISEEIVEVLAKDTRDEVVFKLKSSAAWRNLNKK